MSRRAEAFLRHCLRVLILFKGGYIHTLFFFLVPVSYGFAAPNATSKSPLRCLKVALKFLLRTFSFISSVEIANVLCSTILRELLSVKKIVNFGEREGNIKLINPDTLTQQVSIRCFWKTCFGAFWYLQDLLFGKKWLFPNSSFFRRASVSLSYQKHSFPHSTLKNSSVITWSTKCYALELSTLGLICAPACS